MSGYQGVAGGPSDPATPGGYCLARCLCGTCPQYPAQRAAVELLREQEYGRRVVQDGERAARRSSRSAA